MQRYFCFWCSGVVDTRVAFRRRSLNPLDGDHLRSVGVVSVGGSTERDGLRQPTGIVCFDGRVFVADSMNHRIQVRLVRSAILS